MGRSGPAAEPLVNIVIDATTWGTMLTAAGLSTTTDLDGYPIDPLGLTATDADELLSEFAVSGRRRCETTGGAALHPHDVLRAGLAGHVRRVVGCRPPDFYTDPGIA